MGSVKTPVACLGYWRGGKSAKDSGHIPESLICIENGKMTGLHLEDGRVFYPMATANFTSLSIGEFRRILKTAPFIDRESEAFRKMIFGKLCENPGLYRICESLEVSEPERCHCVPAQRPDYRTEVHSSDGKHLRVRNIAQWQLRPVVSFAHEDEKRAYLKDINTHLDAILSDIETKTALLGYARDSLLREQLRTDIALLIRKRDACRKEIGKWSAFSQNEKTGTDHRERSSGMVSSGIGRVSKGGLPGHVVSVPGTKDVRFSPSVFANEDPDDPETLRKRIRFLSAALEANTRQARTSTDPERLQRLEKIMAKDRSALIEAEISLRKQCPNDPLFSEDRRPTDGFQRTTKERVVTHGMDRPADLHRGTRKGSVVRNSTISKPAAAPSDVVEPVSARPTPESPETEPVSDAFGALLRLMRDASELGHSAIALRSARLRSVPTFGDDVSTVDELGDLSALHRGMSAFRRCLVAAMEKHPEW